MSTNANWSYTAKATVWPRTGSNKNSQSIYGDPVVFPCSYVEQSGTTTDDSGIEFQKGLELYTEFAIQRGSMIATGDQSSFADPLEAKANIVRTVVKYDESLFDDVPDYKIQVERGAS